MPTGRNRPRNIPRGCGTRPARPPWKARCGASPTPMRRRGIACAVAATVPTGLNRPRNIPRGYGTRPATTVEVRCGASPIPTRRRRIACAVAATVPTGRNRPRNIPRGCGTRPARPPWKAGVGQAPPLRAAEGLPARLRRRCRAAGTALAISRGDAGLAPHDHRGRPGVGQAPHLRAAVGLPARLRRRCRPAGTALATSRVEAGLTPHDHRGSPVWGKPHPHAPPKDCLRSCGDGTDRTERPSQYRL